MRGLSVVQEWNFCGMMAVDHGYFVLNISFFSFLLENSMKKFSTC